MVQLHHQLYNVLSYIVILEYFQMVSIKQDMNNFQYQLLHLNNIRFYLHKQVCLFLWLTDALYVSLYLILHCIQSYSQI